MRAFGLVLITLVACDAKTSPVVAPPPAPSSSPVVASASASASSSPAVRDDRVALLQRTLELDRLRPFWHPELPGHVPLRIRKNALVADAPPLVMFGTPVVYVDDDPRAFELTKIDIQAATARIEFRYAREGVVGYAVFRREGDGWLLDEKHVAER